MHFLAIPAVLISVVAGAVALAVAPSEINSRQSTLCPKPLQSIPQCCAFSREIAPGVVEIHCKNPPTVPTSVANFYAVCAKTGIQAVCCAAVLFKGDDLDCSLP
ncbi:hydrophobin-like protein [Mycena olivaceomarginata]|nr:hydrophobin-like protein [Mycena olivaceomarginata]